MDSAPQTPNQISLYGRAAFETGFAYRKLKTYTQTNYFTFLHFEDAECVCVCVEKAQLPLANVGAWIRTAQRPN